MLSLACGPQAGDDAQLPASGSEPERMQDAILHDTILLEGVPEPVELRHVQAPDGFPMPFSTYATPDFAVEAGEGEGEVPTVRFVAEFGGARNDEAFLEIAAHPPGTSRAEAEARAMATLEGPAEPVPEQERRRGWALAEWRLRDGAAPGSGEARIGRVGLGTREGRYFHVLTRYPAEYGDGFGPRAASILDHWRWNDDTPLGGS
jgi:hypothetical protein